VEIIVALLSSRGFGVNVPVNNVTQMVSGYCVVWFFPTYSQTTGSGHALFFYGGNLSRWTRRLGDDRGGDFFG
jgi:hypothetical protein